MPKVTESTVSNAYAELEQATLAMARAVDNFQKAFTSPGTAALSSCVDALTSTLEDIDSDISQHFDSH